MRKKKSEMFSSGCNLSLSRLQHSRVILQHSPARRTEVALCLGLTQAHIHLKPSAHSAATICAAATTTTAPHLQSSTLLSRIFRFRGNKDPNFTQSGFLCDVALVMKQCRTKLPLIGGAIDKSNFFSPALRKNITVLNAMLVFHFRVSDFWAKSETSGGFAAQLRGDRAVENAVNTV